MNLARFAALALDCITREYPHNPGHVMRHAGDLHAPRALHPAFYGCFDWHSAVHGHWLLAHLLRRHPGLPQEAAIRAALEANLTASNLQTEAVYLAEHREFERPYGWAWLLKLAEELTGWDDPDGARWLAQLQPLARAIESNTLAWLPKQTYPIRSGTHANTAFGFSFALDYAQAAGREALQNFLKQKSFEYFARDQDYPARWELGGNDFLSPCLVEADLMRRVLPDFPAWFERFLPQIPDSLANPVAAGDRADGQLAHLDGLNLSRAWCFFNLARALPEKPLLQEAAQRHLEAGLALVASGEYAGEHWLASFAVQALACAQGG